MHRTALLALLFGAIAGAQVFTDLASTQDGSVLYFSSAARQKGTQQSFRSKIFRWSASGGVQVIAEETEAGGFDGCTSSGFSQLRFPQVSLDGSQLGYSGSRQVAPSRFCEAEAWQSVILRIGTPLKMPGIATLSPNGR